MGGTTNISPKKPSFDPNAPFQPIQEKDKPAFDQQKPFKEIKKKDENGSPSPSDSSPNQGATGQPVDTGASDSKQTTANFKNNSLTPKDVAGGIGFELGIPPEQVSNALNNKGKNIEKAKNAPSDRSIQSLLKDRDEVDKEISSISYLQSSRPELQSEDYGAKQRKLEDLKAKRDYLSNEIGKSYEYEKKSIIPELKNDLLGILGEKSWVDVFDKSKEKSDNPLLEKLHKHLQWKPETHTLTEDSARWVIDHVDEIMNKKGDNVVNAQVSGDLDNKKRTYADLSRSLIEELNTVPIQKAQQDFTKEYAKKNPEIDKALKANEQMNGYFSNSNFDDLKSKIKIDADKSAISTQEKYYGNNGIFQKNQDYVGIHHKYAQLVADGKMPDDVARKQMDAEINQNSSLKKIKSNYDTEIRKIVENTQKQYEQYIIGGLQQKHPGYTIYKDGTYGLSSLSEDQYKNMTEGYQEGMDDIAKKMGAESNEAWKKYANQAAKAVGPFWGSLGMSTNSLMSGAAKMLFNKTGWGHERVRNFEANEIASPQISQSDEAATWNMTGWESLLNYKFYLSGLGSSIPVIAGAGAVSLATEGAGLPEYAGWLTSAGLFTGQTSLSTYDRLLSTKDTNGHTLSESDAAHYTADQAKADSLPNVLMMGFGSGGLLRAKNISKPTIGRAIAQGVLGAAEAQPFLSWQGYNDYATMLKAQGKEPDIYDYLQSKDFRDNLVNGLIIGGGIGALHTPLNYMKSMDNWTKLVHASEGEFKNLIPQNYALGQEMAGNGNYLRDALKLHVFNVDPEGLNEEGKRNLADLKNTLLYSVNLDKNIRNGNLDKTNINDLYQAHNLALADQHDYLSEQAAKEGNKSLSDIYKDKAKDYREQAKAAANGEAKYKYLVNDDEHPIFMSDKGFKVLEKEGKISQWMSDGTIKDVHDNSDPEFAQRYKDFVTAKSEATIEGKDIMDHGKDLIEENKDKLGTYYAVAKENPDLFYKEVSDQIHGKNAGGSTSLRPDAEVSARQQFGDDIVDLAKTIYPIKEGGTYATPESERKIGEVNQSTGEQEHTRIGSPRDEETQPRTDSGDSGTDGKGKEIAPEDNITVGEMLDKKGTYKGQRGTFTQDGQTVIFKPDNSNREYELGNIEEVGGKSLIDFGIDTEQSVVKVGDKGEITVRDKPYINPNEDPLKAIVRDESGNVVSVKLETPEGQRRTFRGQVAEDLAYDLTLKQISDNHEQPALEEFINTDEAAREEVNNAGLAAPTEEQATGDNQPIQREKIISSPKTEDHGKAKKTKEAQGREGDALTPKGEGEPTPKEPPPPSIPKKTPPPSKPPEPAPVAGTPKEEFTGNTKAKNREIEGAKELFENQGVIHWDENFATALSDVMAKYPNKSWYEALKDNVNHFVGFLDAGVKFNPTSGDHAAFLMFKHETLRQMGMVEGWDSPDSFQRQLADMKVSELQKDLFNTVRVTNPGGETGRALQILQAEIGGDVKNGLKIRRIELVREKGAPLTKEELESSAEDWEKEKAAIQKENELKIKSMQERFDKQIAKLRGDKPVKFNKDKAVRVASNLRGIADKVEKFLKADLPEGTQRMGVDIQKKVADAIRWIAEKIEKGDIRIPDIISSAIDRFKGEKDGSELRDAIHKGMIEAGVDEKTIKGETTRKASFDKIKSLAATEGVTSITSDMVAKNLIRDYLKSHIGLTENADIVGKVANELKSVLPDVSEDQVRKAFLKEDEFRQPTKKEAESHQKESLQKFTSLTKLEKDISDLKEKQTLFKRGSDKGATPFDKDIAAKEKEKNNLMSSLGVKTSSEDKYTKASYDLRAKSHNQRLENLSNGIKNKLETGGLTDEQRKQLLNLKGRIDNSKVNLNPNSAESQEKTLKGALDVLKSVSSEFNRNTSADITKMGDIRRGLQKVIDGFDLDKSESTQDVKLKRAIDKAKRDADMWFGKIQRGEYEDNPIIELTKTNAELLKAQKETEAVHQLYKNKKQKYQKQRKEWAKKTGDFLRAAEVGWLIGSPFTIAKVGASALLRPQLEALSKLGYHYTVEQLPFELNRILTERAKLGGESTSLASIKKGYQAYLMQYGEEGLKKLYAKANEKYEKASQAYIDQEKEVERVKYMGKDKPEYEEATKNLQKLKNEKEEALVDAVGNSIYQFIAGSSLKESLEVFLHRSTALERNFGDFDREAWDAQGKGKLVTGKSLADIDNWNYLINGIGRSHAALKNFSGRFSFATEFMARLEAYAKEGVDISKPDKLLEIAHESYTGWERGKYQESNWISDKWNKLTKDIEKNNPEMAYLMRADVAITRVPVNMLYEGIMEYTLGGLTGSFIAAKEYYKARKMVLQHNFGPEEQGQFKKELYDQLRRMDPKSAAAIVRAYRKQGFGLGMYALFMLGHAAFGGFAHKGMTAEDKKKALREIQTGNPEIKTGEIKLGDWTMPIAAAKIIEHTPGFQLPLMALGLNQVYENSIIDGKSISTAVRDDVLAHIEHITNSIPQIEFVAPIAGDITKRFVLSGQWDDVAQDGTPMKRRAFNASDYFGYLHMPFTDGFKKDILSEAYYKQAVSAQKNYREQITEVETNTSLSKEQKEEQRQSLLKQLDAEIDEIYRLNKEDPQ